MRKEKIYKFNAIGYAQLMLDLRSTKLEKINNIMSVVIVITLFGLGVLGKELFIIMMCNTGMGKITNWLVG